MKPLNTTHLFFDLDHTLWDFDKNSALTFNKIFALNKLNINVTEFLEVYKPINLQYWRLYRSDKISKSYLRYNRLKDAFNALGLEVSDEVINTLSEDYITYLSTFTHLFDQTIEVLNYLKSKYQLHIITNGFKAIQDKKLNNSKIAHYFQTVTNSESTGVKKPNPIIFDYALQNANANPKQSIMIGDSLEADIMGAENCGMQTIWCNFNAVKSDYNGRQVHTISELVNML